MREIEFRGWCEKDSEWKFGCYVTDGVNHEILSRLDSGEMHSSHVNPETVGQFTGLLDVKGVKIFEGDIIDGELLKPYPVVFSECDASVQGSVCEVPLIAFNYRGMPLVTDEDYEIVGSILEVQNV